MTYNTEKYQLGILFGMAKHLKVSVILFKRVRTFFAQEVKPEFFFLYVLFSEKRGLDFTVEVFHIHLLKKKKNHSKIRRFDCGSLRHFSEILKASKCLFSWKF